MTIEEKIEAALFTQCLALEAPVAWPNVPFPGPGEEKPETYIEARIFPNDNTRLFLKGSGPHLRQGILQLTVRTPLNGGGTPVTQLAGEVAENFPADLLLEEDGITVRIQAAPDVGAADKTEDGVSWAAAVSVRYETFA